MCDSQIIHGIGFDNFSIFGLTVLILAGGLVVLLNQTVPTVVRLLQRFKHKGLSRQEEWRLTHSLQLQRKAFKGAGIGSWEGKDREVLVTARSQTFSLPVSVSHSATLLPYSPLPQLHSPQQYDPLMEKDGAGFVGYPYTNGPPY